MNLTEQGLPKKLAYKKRKEGIEKTKVKESNDGNKVIPFGFEPKTYCLEGSCSIQLSYGTVCCSATFIIKKGG